MKIEKELVSRYSKRLPRYTSYPTALEFSDTFSVYDWKKELFAFITSEEQLPLSIYCHIPFCRSLCYFCACNKVISKTRDYVRPYLDALIDEISFYGELLKDRAQVRQLHWGGGTPNFLTPDEITELLNAIRWAFPDFVSEADISIELDPRTTSDQQLETLKASGFNRISLGVQDFDTKVQQAINRIQSYEATELLCKKAKEYGFKALNVDLIYGLPHQTAQSFKRTVELVAQLRPERIALYGYAHVSWKNKTQKLFEKLPLPEAHERLELFVQAVNLLQQQGYRYIGMDHFALPHDELSKALEDGSLHRNFMGYSTHKTAALLGFGLSAISSLPGAFSQNERKLKDYIRRVELGELPVERGLKRSFEDRWRGALIQEIMCRGLIDRTRFEEEWGVQLETAEELLEEPAKDGLVDITRDTIEVTELGRFFLRNIASSFDCYRSEAKESRFSQSV